MDGLARRNLQDGVAHFPVDRPPTSHRCSTLAARDGLNVIDLVLPQSRIRILATHRKDLDNDRRIVRNGFAHCAAIAGALILCFVCRSPSSASLPSCSAP